MRCDNTKQHTAGFVCLKAIFFRLISPFYLGCFWHLLCFVTRACLKNQAVILCIVRMHNPDKYGFPTANRQGETTIPVKSDMFLGFSRALMHVLLYSSTLAGIHHDSLLRSAKHNKCHDDWCVALVDAMMITCLVWTYSRY